MVTVNFILNGKPVSAEADGLTLLKYLRGVACLKGAKEGCSTGHCGACTVLLDGKPVRSCVTRMDKLEGKSVVTIEALHGADGGLLTGIIFAALSRYKSAGEKENRHKGDGDEGQPDVGGYHENKGSD